MGFFESISENPLFLLIPLIAGLVGWITNILAVKMMFHPLDFVGIKPFLGWQGIVPANALRLAQTGVNLVTTRLLDIRILFDNFDPQSLVKQQEERLEKLTRKVIEDKAKEHFPAMWKMLTPEVKEQVFSTALKEIGDLSVEVLEEAAENIKDLIDLEQIVSDAVVADKELMNRIFLRVGSAEFKFIERSGLYFGLAFGFIQLVIWVLTSEADWVLPVFGFVVGYATNWLALKLIFDPKEPKRVGPFTFQGLFHRRQKQIAREFGDIMSARVYTPENVFKELSSGPSRKKLLEIVERRGDARVDQFANNPMAKPLFASGAADEIKKDIMSHVEEEMFREGGFVYSFGDKAEEIREQLGSRMAVMESEAFENVLRPAFRQDEWKLILAGAALGLAAGFAQLLFLFGDKA